MNPAVASPVVRDRGEDERHVLAGLRGQAAADAPEVGVARFGADPVLSMLKFDEQEGQALVHVLMLASLRGI